MRFSLYTLSLALMVCVAANAQVPVVDGSGESLQDLSGSDTFVTVELKDTYGSARDFNLKIKSVNGSEGTITVQKISGEITAYRLDDIDEIHVQKGQVAVKEYTRPPGGNLTTEEATIVSRAVSRVRELFELARDNQGLRMEMASILLTQEDPEALEYLESLARTDDLAVAIVASLELYLGGKTPDTDLIDRGLASGQRAIRGLSALLAGNTRDPQFRSRVRALLKTATNEEFENIAMAAGMLKDTQAIPMLVEALRSLHSPKVVAALDALTKLGGKEVEAAMLKLLKSSDDNLRLSALEILYEIGDAETTRKQATRILQDEFMGSIVHGVEAAMILAPSGDFDAQERLRQFYNEPHDKDIYSLAQRAAAASALFEGGYTPAKSMLRELLNTRSDMIYEKGRTKDEAFKETTVMVVQIAVCVSIAENGSRKLLSLLEAPMQDSNPAVAYSACRAAIAISDAEYRFRLFE